MDKKAHIKHQNFIQFEFINVPVPSIDDGFVFWPHAVKGCEIAAMVSIDENEFITDVGNRDPWFIIICHGVPYHIVYNPLQNKFYYLKSTWKQHTKLPRAGSYEYKDTYYTLTNNVPSDNTKPTIMDKLLFDKAIEIFLNRT